MLFSSLSDEFLLPVEGVPELRYEPGLSHSGLAHAGDSWIEDSCPIL